MVLPTPAADDPLRPETGWIEAIQRTLRLSGKSGVLVHVDGADPSRLGELARALLPDWPDLDVLDGVTGLETAPEGATRVVVPHVEEAFWLNLNRPIVTRRNLKIVLWCDHATTVELSRKAPDFFDWISAHVECPKGLVPFALAGVRGALQAKAPGIHWTGGVDEAAKGAVSELIRACAPGTMVRWVDIEGAYEEVLERVGRMVGSGDWIGAVADAQWKVWRFRWACAEAKSVCPEIVFAPGLECPGFWPVHDRVVSLADASRQLDEAGAAHAGLCASLLHLEPEAVDFAARLLCALVPEQALTKLLAAAPDPGAALVRRAQEDEDLPAVDHTLPMFARAMRRPPSFAHSGLRVEIALQRSSKALGWFELATMALQLGDPSAAAWWSQRELADIPEAAHDAAAIALSFSRADLAEAEATRQRWLGRISQQQTREQTIPNVARKLVTEAMQNGVSTERFTELVVTLASAYLQAGAPRVASSILRKALALGELEATPLHPEDSSAPSTFPFLEPSESARLAHAVSLFFAAPPPPLWPETAAFARSAFIEALRAQGRFEEAALVTSEHPEAS